MELRSAIVKELEAMKQRIAELEAELAAGSGANTADAAKALEGEKEKLQAAARSASSFATKCGAHSGSFSLQADSTTTCDPAPDRSREDSALFRMRIGPG